jgi:hypothetical protein
MTIAIEITKEGIDRVVLNVESPREQAVAHRFLADAAEAIEQFDRSPKSIPRERSSFE